MKTRNILVPLDLENCPLEVFLLINSLDAGASVTMLHVVNLNLLTPPIGLIETLCREARCRLEMIESTILNPGLDSRACVRVGNTATEILAEAENIQADLIVLTHRNHPPLSRVLRVLGPDTNANVIRDARCDVNVLQVRTGFDCTRSEIIAGMLDVKLPEPEPENPRQNAKLTLFLNGSAI